MIVDHDPGDECDHAGYTERATAILRAWFKRMLASRYEPIAPSPAMYMIPIAPFLVFECTIGGARDDHDPGDEDRVQTITAYELAVELHA